MNRKDRGLVRAATTRLLTTEQRDFPSSSSSATYRTIVLADGKVQCTCPGWTIKKRDQARTCKHVRAVVADRPTRTDGEYVYLVQAAPADPFAFIRGGA